MNRCFLFAGVLFIAACNSSTDTTGTTGLQPPDLLRSSQAINFSNVYAEIRVNDGAIQTFRFNTDEPVEIGLRDVNPDAVNNISITWYETFEDLPLVLATQQGQFTADTEAGIVSINLPYDYSANDDGDTLSNIEERRLGQCPRNTCASDQTTTTDTTNPTDQTTTGTTTNDEKSALIPAIVRIDAGCFIMGSPIDEPSRIESEDEHQVCINQAFGMSKFEITERQFEATTTGSDELATSSIKPRINVTVGWAMDYARQLSESTGRKFRLPTEAEWEYAARAGTTTPFSTGNIITSDQANFNGLFPWNGLPAGGQNLRRVVDVGNYDANPWGLHDMHGNVVEWTCSVFAEPFDGSENSCSEPTDNALVFVVRGGAYFSQADGLRSAARFGSRADYAGGVTGFRIVEEY